MPELCDHHDHPREVRDRARDPGRRSVPGRPRTALGSVIDGARR
jgi:hypothetical protein